LERRAARTYRLLASASEYGTEPQRGHTCSEPVSREGAAFDRLQASDAEVVQEPTEQPYGLRDCAVRDPAGNLLRIQELR